MSKKIKSTEEEPATRVIHLILVLCIFGMAYTFFAKTELESVPLKLLTPAEVESEVGKLSFEGSRD